MTQQSDMKTKMDELDARITHIEETLNILDSIDEDELQQLNDASSAIAPKGYANASELLGSITPDICESHMDKLSPELQEQCKKMSTSKKPVYYGVSPNDMKNQTSNKSSDSLPLPLYGGKQPRRNTRRQGTRRQGTRRRQTRRKKPKK